MEGYALGCRQDGQTDASSLCEILMFSLTESELITIIGMGAAFMSVYRIK